MGASFGGVICTRPGLLGCKSTTFGQPSERVPTQRPHSWHPSVEKGCGCLRPRGRRIGRPEIARRRGERRGYRARQGHPHGGGHHRRIPGSAGHRRGSEHRHRVADEADRSHHARLRLRQHGVDQVGHHVHRRRPGHPALPRYPIEQLAQHSTYLEVAWLLIYGELPSASELAAFDERIRRHTLLHEDLKRFFSSLPPTAHPMSVLSAATAALSTYYESESDPHNPEHVELNTVRMLAKLPVIAPTRTRRASVRRSCTPTTRSASSTTSSS